MEVNPMDCIYNCGIDCLNHSRCDKCGWNPKVQKKRIRKIRWELKKGLYRMEYDEKEEHFDESGKDPMPANT